MKLTDYKPSTAEMTLVHPVYGEVEGSLTVVGKYSPQFYNAARKVLKDSGIFTSNIELQESESISALADCVMGWSDDEFFGGPFSTEAVINILSNPEFGWVKEQLEKFVLTSDHFFKKK